MLKSMLRYSYKLKERTKTMTTTTTTDKFAGHKYHEKKLPEFEIVESSDFIPEWNIKYIDIAGDTLLHIAISNKNNDVILPLINKGIDINIGNKNNLTPLHIAVINRDIDLIKLLLSKGAKTDIKDSKGKTAIDYAL